MKNFENFKKILQYTWENTDDKVFQLMEEFYDNEKNKSYNSK